MVFEPSALNRVYNFKQVCPNQGLEPSLTGYVCNDCCQVFGHPNLYLFTRSSVNIRFSGLDISTIFFSIFNSSPGSIQLAL